MKLRTVEYDNKEYAYIVLILKDGQTFPNPNDISQNLTGVVMGISYVNYEGSLGDSFFRLGVEMFTNIETYEANLLKTSSRANPLRSDELIFRQDATAIPSGWLQTLEFNDKWIYGLELTNQFLTAILQLPDPSNNTSESATIGDRWEIEKD